MAAAISCLRPSAIRRRCGGGGALELKPDLAEAWHGRGNVLNELKHYEEALGAYDKALALNLNFAGAWHGRGNVLSEVNRHHEALAAYDKALVLAPDLTEAWLGRGNVLNVLKQSPRRRLPLTTGR